MDSPFRWFLAIALFAAGLAVCHTARADEFHYNNLLIGERAAGMGGAFTAIANDISGMYYNPAGIVYATATSLSASVNAYYSLSKTYRSVIAGEDLKRSYSAIVPNFFGIQQPFGRLHLGFSYGIPEHAFENMDQTFSNLPVDAETRQHLHDPDLRITRYNLNLNTEDSVNEFGPTAALKITEGLSVGLTLYIHKRDSLFVENELLRLSNGRDRWNNWYVKIQEWGVRPVFGILWKPGDRLSLGASLSRTVLLSSDIAYQETAFSEWVDPADVVDIRISTGDKRDYPWQIRCGAAYEITPTWLVSADISLFPGFSYMLLDTSIEREPVVNLALGTEVFLWKDLVFRGGFYTNRSNAPDIRPGMRFLAEKIDIYGVTGSLSYRIKQTSLTVGGSYGQGSGKANITSDRVSQDAEARSWTLFVASTYLF